MLTKDAKSGRTVCASCPQLMNRTGILAASSPIPSARMLLMWVRWWSDPSPTLETLCEKADRSVWFQTCRKQQDAYGLG